MRLKELRPSDLTPEQRELYERLTTGPRGRTHVTANGSLEGPFNLMLHAPVVGEALQRLGAVLRYEGSLPPAARELAILTVAADRRAEFEWYAHATIAQSAGVEPDAIAAIRHGRAPRLADDLERCVVDVTRSLLEAGDLDDAQYERASAVLGAPALVELTTLVGYYRMLADLMHVFRVPLPPGAEEAFPSESLT